MMVKDTICEMCGDWGWENAFVYCVKCLKFAIHRYCLPVIPETFDEFVRWYCVDCEEIYGKPCPSRLPSSVISAKRNLIAAEETPCTDIKKRKYHKPANNSSEIKTNLNLTKETEKATPIKVTDAKKHDKESLRSCGTFSELAKSDKVVHDSPPSRKRSKKSRKSRSVKKIISTLVDVATELEELKEPCEENNENLISDGGKLCESVADVARVGPDSRIVEVESSKVPDDSYHIRAQEPCGTVSELEKSDKKVHDSPPSRKGSNRSSKSRSKKKTTDGGKLYETVADVAKLALDSQISKVPEDSYHIHTQKTCEENNGNVVSEGSKLCETAADMASVAPDSQTVPVYSSKVLESCERNGANLGPANGKSCGTAADVAYIPNDSQSVCIVPEDSCYIRAQPVIDPIWSGNFNIESDENGLIDGIVAHMSSKACPMACEEAKLFSKSLYMELSPRTSVWPKSFQISDPTDDNIALYFFASNESYDELVTKMSVKDLALRSVVTNAELLVFTSKELPFDYWMFNGDFYLWGVFRKKQAPPSNSANDKNGEIKNVTNNKRMIINQNFGTPVEN